MKRRGRKEEKVVEMTRVCWVRNKMQTTNSFINLKLIDLIDQLTIH